MAAPDPQEVAPWYLRNITQALALDESTGNVYVRTGVTGDIVIEGNVNIPGSIDVEKLGNIVLSGNTMPVSGNVTVLQGTTPWQITGNANVAGNVGITGNVTIGSLPEVEIKNDAGNAIPVTTSYTASTVGFAPAQTDAFGRFRVSQPYTLFDSQNQEAADPQFDTAVAGTGNVAYNDNESTVLLTVQTSGDAVTRQTFRSMPYQPGKSLLVLATFVLNTAETNLRQRVGYFNTNDGVFFEKSNGVLNFVLRSSVTGSPSDARTVPQSSWNGDRLDGTGGANNPSGITLDPSKAQILWMDFEWLGVGSVRCGFIIDGQYYVCHTFHNANQITSVYMKTATLPVRYEITATGALGTTATMKQICSSVMSEGGYDQVSTDYVARRDTAVTGIVNTFVPLVSIRLASAFLDSVVLPNRVLVMPTASGFYEVALLKNATLGGTPAWNPVPGDPDVEFDVAANTVSGGTIAQLDYVTATNQSQGAIVGDTGYNWNLQLGVSLTGVSDVYTVAVRQLGTTPTVSAIGALTFYDLTR